MGILSEIKAVKKDYRIGLPCSPARRVGYEIVNAKKILLTFGGGMGGANTTVYATDNEIVYNEHGIANVIDIFTDKEVEINTKYVVKVENLRLLVDKIDITAHANYHKINCKSHILTRVLELPNDFGNPIFYNSYDHGENKFKCAREFYVEIK